MVHEEKIQWMATWAARNNAQLKLEGECGFGRECVGILVDGNYPDFDYKDDIWEPADSYHKHNCVAVLGRGEEAENQLFEWLQWFENNGFKIETGDVPKEEWERLGAIALMMGKYKYAKMIKKEDGEGRHDNKRSE